MGPAGAEAGSQIELSFSIPQHRLTHKPDNAAGEMHREPQQPKPGGAQYDLLHSIPAADLGKKTETIVNQVARADRREQQERTDTSPSKEHHNINCNDPEQSSHRSPGQVRLRACFTMAK
jgi:hypothetical protein